MYRNFSDLSEQTGGKDSTVIDLLNSDQKESIIHSNLLTVVDIYADWCMPCRQTESIYADLAKKYNKQGVCALVKEKYETKLTNPPPQALPTYKFYFQGRPVGADIVGGNIEGVEKRIVEYLQNMPQNDQISEVPQLPHHNKSSVRNSRTLPQGRYQENDMEAKFAPNKSGYNPYRTG